MPAAVAVLAALLAPPQARAAGNVTAVVSGNVLLVQGDAADNFIEIVQDSGTIFEVNGLTGTTVNGGASVSFDNAVVSKEIRIDLGIGSDVVDGVRNVVVDTLRIQGSTGGTFAVNVQSVKVGRFEYAGSAADDLVSFAGVAGGMTVDLASGTDRVTIRAPQPDAGVPGIGRKGIKVTGEDGVKEVTVDTTFNAGKTQIALKGAPETLIELVNSQLEGDVKVKTGGGGDAVLYAANSLGTVQLDLGAGDAAVTVAAFAGARDLRILTKGGTTNVQIDGLSLEKALAIKTGDGPVVIDATAIGTKAQIKTGDGPCSIALGGTFPSGIAIDTRSGDAAVAIANVVAGKTVVKSRDGDVSLTVTDSNVAKGLVMSLKNVATAVSVADTTADKLQIKLSGGPTSVDLLNVTAPVMRITGTKGADDVAIDDSTATSLKIQTGDGQDSVRIDTAAGTATPTLIQGSSLIQLGAGGDFVALGGPSGVTTRVFTLDTLTIDGGPDDDTLDWIGHTNLFQEPIEVKNVETEQ